MSQDLLHLLMHSLNPYLPDLKPEPLVENCSQRRYQIFGVGNCVEQMVVLLDKQVLPAVRSPR